MPKRRDEVGLLVEPNADMGIFFLGTPFNRIEEVLEARIEPTMFDPCTLQIQGNK
jgi:hypothetical protein